MLPTLAPVVCGSSTWEPHFPAMAFWWAVLVLGVEAKWPLRGGKEADVASASGHKVPASFDCATWRIEKTRTKLTRVSEKKGWKLQKRGES